MKKIAASDSRQSVGLKWKLRKGLEENVAFKEDGTMEVGKNAVVDGTLTLNTPENLIFKTGAISSEPEGYAVDGSGNVTIAGSLKANNNGDVEVFKNLNAEGNVSAGGNNIAIGDITYEGSTMPGITIVLNGVPFYWAPNAIINSQTGDIVLPVTTSGDGQLMNDLTVGGYSLDTSVSLANSASQAKYQHTVTLSGDGFEFCFTAKSSKDTPVRSYQDLGTVFGGCRIGLTGFSAALSARPVYIDLHGGTAATDFIRVYNEAGGGFSNKTLSSIGTIIYEDDVCIPK